MDEEGVCPYCGSKGFRCRDEALSSIEGGVRIFRLPRPGEEREPMHTLKSETYVNANSTKVVKKGSVESAFLLGLAGDEISDETAERLGLLEADAPVDATPSSRYAGMKKAELVE